MAGIKRRALADEERRQQQIVLGELADRQVAVFCWCNRCSHNAVLEIRPLIAQLGPLCPVPEVGARLVCSSCGSKDIATRPAWRGLGQVARHQPCEPAAVPAPPAPEES